MDSPEVPPPIPQPPRLVRRFCLFFFTPLAVMAVTFLILAQNKNLEGIIWVPMIAGVAGSIGAAATLAQILARTVGIRIVLGIVAFGVIQIVYLFCFFAGCTAATGPMTFH